MERENLVLQAGLADPFPVVGGVDPPIVGPNLYAEFPGHKNRAERLATAHVEDAHPRLQVHDLGQAFGQPDGVRAHRIIHYPLEVVAGRTRVFGEGKIIGHYVII